jgi:hypothetical protein
VFNWDRIEDFIGYGNLGAPVVFIGIEESGVEDKERLIADLKERSRWGTVEDRKFHNFVATWNPMCDLMLRRANITPDTATRKEYRLKRLGLLQQETLLTELLPYPVKSSKSKWPYGEDPFNKEKTKEEYKARVLGPRQRLLKDVLKGRTRELIVCYGKECWSDFKGLFEGASWEPEPPSGYQVGQWESQRVVLSHHFAYIYNLKRLAEVCWGSRSQG